ncbi:MAG: hypothetical protein ABW091_13815 [Microbacterium sp.]
MRSVTAPPESVGRVTTPIVARSFLVAQHPVAIEQAVRVLRTGSARA